MTNVRIMQNREYLPGSDWPYMLASRCLRTKRRKKRAQKDDFQKQLLEIGRLEDTLELQRKNLPFLPLPEPYQKGWKRFFVLREDVARSENAPFYELLLRKINTIEYSKSKSFIYRERRDKKQVRSERLQYLQEFESYEWNRPDNPLTARERKLFTMVEKRRKGRTVQLYRFSEPWRYVLKIEPHFITHHKVVDEVLEQRISQLNNFIDRRNLRNAMCKAEYGCSLVRKRFDEKEKYRDPWKGFPLHRKLGAALDES